MSNEYLKESIYPKVKGRMMPIESSHWTRGAVNPGNVSSSRKDTIIDITNKYTKTVLKKTTFFYKPEKIFLMIIINYVIIFMNLFFTSNQIKRSTSTD